MNADRLASVVEAINNDNSAHNILQLLNNLEQTYTVSVQTPDPAHAHNFDAARAAISDAAGDSWVSVLSPSRLRILSTIGGDHFVGPGLEAAVESTIAQSATPSNAIEALQKLRAAAESFFATTSQLAKGFETLRIESEEVAEGEAEVEVRIPSALVSGRLRVFGEEAVKISRSLEQISETATGSPAPIAIRSFDSGSIQIFISLDPVSGAAILTFVTAVVQLMNAIVGARQSRAVLERDEAPADALRQLREWESERISNELDRIRDELLDKYSGDSGRKNELRTGLSSSLKFLADRIDRGMDISVFSEPEAVEAESESDETEKTPAEIAHETIAELGADLLKLDRPEEPVLLLDEGVSTDDKSE